ncbi:MAG: TlpA family protein disulfide reductase [Pirellulaceae bacterium]|nr:TlpA family protein disulfide reductase [Pirellulaceae bacterium]
MNRMCCIVGLLSWLVAVGCDRSVVKHAQPDTGTTHSTQAGQVTNQSTVSLESSGQQTQFDSLPDNQPSVASSATQVTDAPAKSASSTATAPPSLIEQRVLAIEPVQSEDPQRMIQHLSELDRAIQDVLLASSRMHEQAARDAAVRLSQMKLQAGKHLAGLAGASAEQAKSGIQAQLVALSHLSGLKDVAAARQLEELATQLSGHADDQLRHQSHVVLVGFKIQQLQNGVISDPTAVLSAASDLISDPQYRGRLEMTSLAHVIGVLYQMGYAQQAQPLQQQVFEAYSQSADAQLRNEAWNQLTRQSPAVDNFLASLQSMQAVQFDPTPVLVAARGLVQEFPNPVTLEMIAGVVTNIEYSGHVALSQDLIRLIETQAESLPLAASAGVIRAAIDEHRQRTSWLGQPLKIEGLVDLSQQTVDLQQFAGKVMLVDFWATWCAPCLNEIPHIKRAHDELSEQGFAVLSINMDHELADVQKFAQSHPMPWNVCRPLDGDTRSLTEQFGITLFPHTLLVDRDGNVAALHVRGERLLTEVRRLLE